MSKKNESVAPDAAHAPGLEKWLVVCLLAFVPGSLIVILPRATLNEWIVPIVGSMCAFVAVGMLMLVREELMRRRVERRAARREQQVA